MNSGSAPSGKDRERMLKTIQRTSEFLTDLSARGCASVEGADLKRLKNIVEALKYRRLDSLAAILGQLRSAIDRGAAGAGEKNVRRISELVTEAFFTCKAVKTYLMGRLDDPRIFERLAGKRWKPEELETIDDTTLLKVGQENSHGRKGILIRNEYYLDPANGALYRIETLVDAFAVPDRDKAKAARARRGMQALTVTRARLVPDFPPQRIIVEDAFPDHVQAEQAARVPLHCPASFEQLMGRYKAFRSNVFAPADFYTLLRFHRAYSTAGELYLVDRDESLLRLDLSFNDGAQARFLHQLIYGRFEMLFGRLTVVGQDPVIAPLSVFHRDDVPPFIYLAATLEGVEA